MINFLTGSNPSNFISSIAKANINFEIASSSKYNRVIDRKIVILNDSAEGFVPAKLYNQLRILEENTEQESIPWSQKGKLLELIN